MVFVTPLYYYGISAQLKTLIDRFCAFSSIQRKHMKSALISAAWNSGNWTFEALVAHYKTLVWYLNLKDLGTYPVLLFYRQAHSDTFVPYSAKFLLICERNRSAIGVKV